MEPPVFSSDQASDCRRPEKDTQRNKACSMGARHLNGLLIVAILLISTAPLYAQRQQQNVAKLNADARNLVGIIGSDKTKTQTYCQIDDLSEQLIQAVQEKDRKKANALAEKIAELYKKWVPNLPL
jgi:ABC-type transport system substrate-binding protein